MLKAELKYITSHRLLLVALIIIALIPSIYAVTFLKSMWDPYGKTGDLPVAIVNHDQSATMNGQKLTLGHNLASTLKDSKSLDFEVVSARKAHQGLKQGKYYGVYTIPANFSKNATTVFSRHPRQLQLHLETSSGHNFFAGKIATTAASNMQRQLNGQLNAAYTKTLAAGLNKVGRGMATASTGAGKLAKGSATLQSGSQQLTSGLQTSADGEQRLATSAGQLASGSAEYVAGVHTASAGSQTLAGGLAQSASGAQSVASGAQKLSANLATLQSGSQTLASQSAAFSAQLKQFAQTLAASNTGAASQQLATLLQATAQTLNAERQAQSAAIDQTKSNVAATAAQLNLNADQTAQLQTAATSAYSATAAKQSASVQPLLTQLQAALTTLSGSADQSSKLSTALNQLTMGSDRLTAGTTQIANGAAALSAGSTQLVAGSTQLANGSGQLLAGATNLNSGLAVLSSKGQTLSTGAGQLATGASTLAAGGSQLVSGSNQLQSGSASLSTGSQTLAKKLNAGASAVPKLKVTQATTKMLTSPTTVKAHERDSVPNNGTAMAPYMAGVALYVLALAVNLMYDTVSPHTKPKNGVQWWASKSVIINGVAVLGGTLEYLFLRTIAGLKPEQGFATWLVIVLTALVLMNMVTWLNLALKQLGSFVAMVLLVLQLSSSAGTYPIVLSGTFFERLHPYLPISYTVDALRHTIMMSDWPSTDLWVLIGFFIAFAALLLLNYTRRFLRTSPSAFSDEDSKEIDNSIG